MSERAVRKSTSKLTAVGKMEPLVSAQEDEGDTEPWAVAPVYRVGSDESLTKCWPSQGYVVGDGLDNKLLYLLLSNEALDQVCKLREYKDLGVRLEPLVFVRLGWLNSST